MHACQYIPNLKFPIPTFLLIDNDKAQLTPGDAHQQLLEVTEILHIVVIVDAALGDFVILVDGQLGQCFLYYSAACVHHYVNALFGGHLESDLVLAVLGGSTKYVVLD